MLSSSRRSCYHLPRRSWSAQCQSFGTSLSVPLDIFCQFGDADRVRSVGVLTSLTSQTSQLQSELGHFRKVLEGLHDQGRLPKKCLCTEPHTQATGTLADGGLHGSGSACWRRCVAGLTSTDSL